MKQTIIALFAFLLIASTISAQVIRSGQNLLLASKTNDGPINVREYPSTKAKVVAKLQRGDKVLVWGMAEGREIIDGERGYWLQVDYGKAPLALGWVYATYVEGGKKLKPRRVVIGERSATDPNLLSFRAEGDAGSIVHTTRVYKTESADFYTFCVTDPAEERSYDELLGTFAWYPATNEARYVTPLLDYGQGVYLTDDLEFAVRAESFATLYNGLKPVAVYRISDGKKLFDGFGPSQDTLSGRSIRIALVYKAGNALGVDRETEKHALEFMAERSIDSIPRYGYVVVNYELAIDTMKRDFLDCRYEEEME
jgi:hypothetical protein